jgi:nucleoside-diphosphate-sugar epimerase
MRVFVTGATGFVGSAVVRELLGAGHKVLGVARSDEGAAALAAAGAEVWRGTLEDPAGLAEGARGCDGVAHLAFNHDFAKFAENGKTDAAAIEALGEALAGSDKPLLVTSGVARLGNGRPGTENDSLPPGLPRFSEPAADAQIAKGVRAGAVRLPPITHADGVGGFANYLVPLAQGKGFAAYIGEGSNRWAGGHRDDAAKVFRLALEKGEAGQRHHAIDEEGVPTRDIAEAIGKRLGVPAKSLSQEEAAEYFGWFAMFAGLEMSASSALTRERLGWTPTHKGLLADLAQGA